MTQVEHIADDIEDAARDAFDGVMDPVAIEIAVQRIESAVADIRSTIRAAYPDVNWSDIVAQ